MKTKYLPLKYVAIIQILVLIVASASFSAAPGWDSVPKRLKHGSGVEVSGDYLYVTGSSCINNIRPDKAHEIAKKKSLLRALQLATFYGSCKLEDLGWEIEDVNESYIIFSPLAKSITTQGTQVIRQWEKKDCNYTTIAVPKHEIYKVQYEFTDPKQIISQYLKFDGQTEKGLLLCLKYTDQYSKLRREVETALFKNLIEIGNIGAFCLPMGSYSNQANSITSNISIQNRIYRADKLIESIEPHLYKKGKIIDFKKNEDLSLLLISAINLAPNYSKIYLALADWADTFYSPFIAQYACEKAMIDGNNLRNALKRKVKYLKERNSPETAVFELLFSQLKQMPDEWMINSFSEYWPENWETGMRIIRGNTIAGLVAASLGQAVRSDPQKPPGEFAEAIALYKKSNSDDDLINVLKVLFKACEKEPASPEVYNLIGACFRHLGQYEMALPFLWQALVLKPGFDLSLTNLGLCCKELGLNKSAVYYFNHDAVKNSQNKWVISSYDSFFSSKKE